MSVSHVSAVSAIVSWQIYVHSPMDEPPTYCTLFNHMVKAGGSSIKDRLFEEASVDGVRNPGARAGGSSLPR